MRAFAYELRAEHGVRSSMLNLVGVDSDHHPSGHPHFFPDKVYTHFIAWLVRELRADETIRSARPDFTPSRYRKTFRAVLRHATR
jgi:hypothetical protein